MEKAKAGYQHQAKRSRTSGKTSNATMSACDDSEERRRQERNLREQQRSQRISEQIKELQNILSESNIPFKPTRSSTLSSVVDYIKQLQNQAVSLDTEHKKILDTINQTNEMMSSGNAEDVSPPTRVVPSAGSDADVLFTRDINYRNVFNQCSAALGVAALDGRFIDCNLEFEMISGYSKQDLRKLSLFNLVTNADMEQVFKVMGDLLKNPTQNPGDDESGGIGATDLAQSIPQSHWSGVVFTPSKDVSSRVTMNITLTRSSGGMPKFFNCTLISTT